MLQVIHSQLFCALLIASEYCCKQNWYRRSCAGVYDVILDILLDQRCQVVPSPELLPDQKGTLLPSKKLRQHNRFSDGTAALPTSISV